MAGLGYLNQYISGVIFLLIGTLQLSVSFGIENDVIRNLLIAPDPIHGAALLLIGTVFLAGAGKAGIDRYRLISFTMVALSLDISTRELRNRLQTLENMGHIEKLPGIGGEKACTFCPTASGCESCGSNLQFPDTYRITSKGRNLISERTV